MDTPLLWHIPLSHYSEKVRWALDYRGIAHLSLPQIKSGRIDGAIRREGRAL
jgi:hypothetical protein